MTVSKIFTRFLNRIYTGIANSILDNAEDCSVLPRQSFKRKACHNEFGMCLLLLGVGGYFLYNTIERSIQLNASLGDVVEERVVKSEEQLRDEIESLVISGAFAGEQTIPAKSEKTLPEVYEEKDISTCSQAGHRASLLDRNSEYLAIEIELLSNFTIDTNVIRPLSKEEIDDLASVLHRILQTKSLNSLKAALSHPQKKTHISANLSPVQAKKIMMLEGDFSPALNIYGGARRTYPKQKLYSHTLGYVHRDYCPAGGLELSLNSLIVNKKMQEIRLSLDSDIQYIAMDELQKAVKATNSEAGFAIVMDVMSGEIIAEVSLPDYDPNTVRSLINNHPEEWQRRSTHWGMHEAELGSVLKVVNTALAIESGIPMDETFDTDRELRIAGRRIAEPFRPRFDYDVLSTLIKSSNRGTALIVQKVGYDKQSKFLRRFGLVSEEKFKKISRKPNKLDRAYYSIGYGLLIKPMALLSAFSSLVNGGCKVTPTYHYQVSPTCEGEKIYDQENSRILRDMLLTNVVHHQGTGKGAYRAGTMLGLKTGTAKIYGGGEYTENTRASVIGMFPAHAPKYSLFVSLYKPKDENGDAANAGKVTAPVAGNIVQRIAHKKQMLLDQEQLEQLERNHVLPTQFDNEIKIAQY